MRRPPAEPVPPDEPARRLAQQGVQLVQLVYADVLGVQKGLTLPVQQAAAAWDGGVRVDGASLEGFMRVEEREMRLRAGGEQVFVLPWEPAGGRVAMVPAGIYTRDGRPFDGCPRERLQAAVRRLDGLGVTVELAFEMEFYLLRRRRGRPEVRVPDRTGYLDLSVRDAGEPVRQEIALALEGMGIVVESVHHAVAPAQHEIDLGWQPPLTAADHLLIARRAVYAVAERHGMHATLLPKPRAGTHGSGLHVRMRVRPAPGSGWSRAAVTRHWLAGLLHHARPLCAVTNPLVNSYKRLVPGFEAPVYVVWGRDTHAPLARLVAGWEAGELEWRAPDPCCHPYLALAVLLRAGADGLERRLEPPPPLEENVFELDPAEIAARGLEPLPGSLGEALDDMRLSGLVRETLGDYLFSRYLEAKRTEWDIYRVQVHQWELDQYLPIF
ncbi:glutamine synthetase [Thermaerobacter sp. PB12/4term]|uniref:glutamine synthetase family protein n=1 Tax=Thermaerobacter sp. PB12/4term TaxID=2293838 RepID=UPI000E326CDA|nr:glutamine synthetase family protein [Thermaerobacter sp. PB12/4term]QIA26470.1 glutamine synthetase [Thermaerobacter sp. PB12/4term]